MRTALICIVLCGVNLIGQPSPEDRAATFSKLKPILMALKNPGPSRSLLENQLVETMMSLADRDRQPSRITVISFAAEFIGDLAGRELTKAQLDAVQQSIGGVLSGSTTNLNSASRFREALTAVGIDALKKRTLITRFVAIGEEVRGPDDAPAQPLRGLNK